MDRDAIIKEAREWIETPWQHQASLKGVATDCIGLVRGVYNVLNPESPIGVVVDYPADWHLFYKEPRMYDGFRKYAGAEIPLAKARGGDIITFSFRVRFVDHHVGILTNDGTFIHSYMDVGKVVETRLDDTWKVRMRHAFKFPGGDG